MDTCYLLLSVLAASYAWRLFYQKRNSYRLPPGPTGYPLIGNALGTPHHHPWLTYAEWAKQYGDVISYQSFGHTTIILNSLESATALLDKRSANCSDRPRMIMANELMGWDWDFVRMRYGDTWRRHRRVFHRYFQPHNLASYQTFQSQATTNFLEQISHSPEKFADHVRQLVASVVLRLAYGYDVKEENDFYVNLVHRALAPLMEVVHAGIYLVEFLPFLRYIPIWFPGATFKRTAAEGSARAKEVLEIPFGNVQKEMDKGIAQQSFVADNLQQLQLGNGRSVLDEAEIVKNCAGIMYLAGSDTTASLILAWQLAMIHFPDVQRRAQTEVDKVVGHARLPNLHDRPALPYLEAMLLETLRWHAITPLAIPHRVMRDDEYNGYRIPAGATITPNTWAILHDPALYPDPLEFKPERFLDDRHENLTFAHQPDPTTAGSFGFGRRVCPGQHLALSTGWLVMANIVATYNLSKATDMDGNIIEPRIVFKDGVVSNPEPYVLQYTPRSDDILKLIQSSKSVLV